MFLPAGLSQMQKAPDHPHLKKRSHCPFAQTGQKHQ